MVIEQEFVAILLVARAERVQVLVLRLFGEDASAGLQEIVTDLLVPVVLRDVEMRDECSLQFRRVCAEANESDEVLLVHDVVLVLDGENGNENATKAELVGVLDERMLKRRLDLVLELGDAVREERGDQRRWKDERVEQTGEDEHGNDDAEKKKNERESIAETRTRDWSENLDAFLGAQALDVETIRQTEVTNVVRRAAGFRLEDGALHGCTFLHDQQHATNGSGHSKRSACEFGAR